MIIDFIDLTQNTVYHILLCFAIINHYRLSKASERGLPHFRAEGDTSIAS